MGRHRFFVLRGAIDTFITIPMLLILILIASFMRVVHIWMTALILVMPSWAWPAMQIHATFKPQIKRICLYQEFEIFSHYNYS